MSLLKKNPSNAGESIIEVVIVAFFLASMFTALVSLIIVSISRNRLAKERSVATRLAQQGMEWLRGERDALGYSPFELRADGTHCIMDADVDGLVGTMNLQSCVLAQCPADCLNATTGFSRWIEGVVNVNPAPVGVNVTMHVRNIRWHNQPEITLSGVFYQWQR